MFLVTRSRFVLISLREFARTLVHEGLTAYVFYCTSVIASHRSPDTRRFQLRGNRDAEGIDHALWMNPSRLPPSVFARPPHRMRRNLACSSITRARSSRAGGIPYKLTSSFRPMLPPYTSCNHAPSGAWSSKRNSHSRGSAVTSTGFVKRNSHSRGSAVTSTGLRG